MSACSSWCASSTIFPHANSLIILQHAIAAGHHSLRCRPHLPIAPVPQMAAQLPCPVQAAAPMVAGFLRSDIASRVQASTQRPHPVQRSSSTYTITPSPPRCKLQLYADTASRRCQVLPSMCWPHIGSRVGARRGRRRPGTRERAANPPSQAPARWRRSFPAAAQFRGPGGDGRLLRFSGPLRGQGLTSPGCAALSPACAARSNVPNCASANGPR